MHGDEDLIRPITGDVMPVLRRDQFFDSLDNIMCRAEISTEVAIRCDGTHKLTRQLLLERGFDCDAIDDVISVLQSLGGCCDCEVLYKVAPQSA
jgi:hypothetical protein